MFLNTWSVTSAFLAGVGILLSVVILVVCVADRFGRCDGTGDRREGVVSDRAHLLLLVVGVLGGVRLIAWPLFYGLLKSFVPELALSGVMCAYGVARLDGAIVFPVQFLQPAALAALGFAFLTIRSTCGTPARRIAGTVAAVAASASVLVMGECALEGIYVFREKSERPVTCCTQYIDTPSTDIAGRAGFDRDPLVGGFLGTTPIWFLYTASMVAMTAGIAGHLRERFSRWGWYIAAFTGPLGLGGLLITGFYWVNFVAPRVLQRPYHHCVYELITDMPVMAAAAAAAIAGNVCLLWPVGLLLVGTVLKVPINGAVRHVYGFCALALATELVIVLVHVL